jgi:hypothetical protein
MRILFRQRDPRARARVVFANFALLAGFMLWIFVHPASAIGRDAIHFASGMLIGLSFTMNLITITRIRRCAANKHNLPDSMNEVQ